MTLVTQQQKKHCLIACSEHEVNSGLCDCINRMRSEAQKIEEVKIGHYYRHYKGSIYKVTSTSIREESGEISINYTNSKGVQFNRLLSEWNKPAILDCQEVERYAEIG